MFSRIPITKSTESYSDSIKRLKKAIDDADAIIIGAGAGLSTSAGYTYTGDRFLKHFADFNKKYGITDIYSGGFYPYQTLEEYWAWWSRHIYLNRYTDIPNTTYDLLLDLVKSKDYFVITTNVDHCFQRSGFDKERLFYTQGDYGLFQCSKPCCQKTFDNEKIVKAMYEQQRDMKVPAELIPRCPNCNRALIPNLRCDDSFVQDEGWYKASERYSNFINSTKNQKVLFLELGIGYNTPVIIKYPFWRYTAENKNATYACINFGDASAPIEIADRSICIESDIHYLLEHLI